MFLKLKQNPVGLFVVVLGPDGAGKSTLIVGSNKKLRGAFKHYWHFHWRPTLLPKLSSTNRGLKTAPHPAFSDKPAYGTVISFLRYCYYLTDFIVGYWVLIWPRRMRGTVIIGERWYFDVIAYPARYGFLLPDWILRAGGCLVPKPDLTLLLETDPYVIHDRKPELTVEQINVQLARLERFIPSPPEGVRIATGCKITDSIDLFTRTIISFKHTVG